MNTKTITISAVILITILVVSALVYRGTSPQAGPDLENINSFEDCVKAGYPVAESFPERCILPDGRSFVNESQVLVPDSGNEDAIRLAVIAYASQSMNVEPSEVVITSVKKTEWPNSCLGIEEPDQVCLQVITPGFRVTATIKGEERIYHTNADGRAIREAKE